MAAQGLRNVGELIANGDTRLPDVARLVLQVLANQIEQIIRANASTTAKHPNLAAYPNLTPRPVKPSLNRVPVQVRARRALWALGVASTSQIDEWAHPRGRSRRRTDYTRRVLERIAVKVGRASTWGRPWLWKLRDPRG